MTIEDFKKYALNELKNSPSPMLDVNVLLEHFLDFNKTVLLSLTEPISKKSALVSFPKADFSVFVYIPLFFFVFSLFFVNLRTIARHPRSAIRFGSTIKPLNISAISHTRSTFNVDPMITQITTITA